MLEPQNIGAGGPTGVVGGCFPYLLNILTEIPNASIDSLALGPHAFEYTGEDTSDLADPVTRKTPGIWISARWRKFPLAPTLRSSASSTDSDAFDWCFVIVAGAPEKDICMIRSAKC